MRTLIRSFRVSNRFNSLARDSIPHLMVCTIRVRTGSRHGDTRTFFLRRFHTFFGTKVQRQIILGGVLLQTNLHTSSESAAEYRKIEFQNSVSALSPILGSTADTYSGACLRILRSILVQFQDIHVTIKTVMSFLYSRHNTGIVMYPSDGAHKISETSLLASL